MEKGTSSRLDAWTIETSRSPLVRTELLGHDRQPQRNLQGGHYHAAHGDIAMLLRIPSRYGSLKRYLAWTIGNRGLFLEGKSNSRHFLCGTQTTDCLLVDGIIDRPE